MGRMRRERKKRQRMRYMIRRLVLGLGIICIAALPVLLFSRGEESAPVAELLKDNLPPRFKQPFPGGEGWDRMYFGKLKGSLGLSELMTFSKRAANVRAADTFFSDDLFIGDSRTVGLRQYSGMETPDFFCATGMSVYNLFTSTVNIKGESFTLERLLAERSYKRIFVMLGINELAHSVEDITEKYAAALDGIASAQPEAEIYVQLNMRVTIDRSAVDPKYNNPRIDRLNESIAALAAERDIPVLDVNPLFDDGQGNLSAKYTFDHTHVVGKYYRAWAAWLYLSLNNKKRYR